MERAKGAFESADARCFQLQVLFAPWFPSRQTTGGSHWGRRRNSSLGSIWRTARTDDLLPRMVVDYRFCISTVYVRRTEGAPRTRWQVVAAGFVWRIGPDQVAQIVAKSCDVARYTSGLLESWLVITTDRHRVSSMAEFTTAAQTTDTGRPSSVSFSSTRFGGIKLAPALRTRGVIRRGIWPPPTTTARMLS